MKKCVNACMCAFMCAEAEGAETEGICPQCGLQIKEG